MRLNHGGNRYQLWPITIRWGKTSSRPFSWHYFQTGFEPASIDVWGDGCMPGVRRTMGQVLHFWRIKIVFWPLAGRRAADRLEHA